MSIPLMSALSMQLISDRNGAPISGAKVYFFDAGTTTPKAVFADPGRLIAHPSPVLTSLSGRVPAIYFGDGYYRVQITDQYGVLIDDFDHVQGSIPETVTLPPPTPSNVTIPTGFVLPSVGDAVLSDAGWLRCNGRTMGSSASDGLEYKGDNALSLYTMLYDVAGLTVAGGKGASAAADFAAGKSITLPDFRGRAAVGRDGMGNGLSGRLISSVFATPDAACSYGGAGQIALSASEMPAHHHAFTTGSAGAHNHANSVTDSQGMHYHATPFGNYNLDALAASGTGGTARNSYYTTATVTEASGAHAHSLSILVDGAHVHTGATDDAGGGGAHNNYQPSALVTHYIRL